MMLQDDEMRIVQVAIGSGDSFVIALRANGTLVIWGWDVYGRCDIPDIESPIRQFDVSVQHVLAVTVDGRVIAWGRLSGSVPSTFNDVVKVATHEEMSLVMTSEGKLIVFQPRVRRSSEDASVDTGIEIPICVRDIAAGFGHVLVVQDNGQIMQRGNSRSAPVIQRPIKQIIAGDEISFAVTDDGNIIAWGGDHIDRLSDTPIGLSGVKQVAVCKRRTRHALALQHNGYIVAWGWNRYGQCDVPAQLQDVLNIASGMELSLAVTRDNQITIWGNTRRQVLPSGGTHIVQIDAKYHHVLAVNRDGVVYAWGNNEYGQSNVPQYLPHVVQVATGKYHSVVLTQTGQVVAWGLHTNGQCAIPFEAHDVIAITAGDNHSIALTRDGRVIAWGSDSHGQCKVPTNLHDVVQIAAGFEYSLALTRTGKIVTWGNTNTFIDTIFSLIGNRTVTRVYTGQHRAYLVVDNQSILECGPISLPLPTNFHNVQQMAVGTEHSLALLLNGQVIAWGQNHAGQCDTPVWLRDVVQIAASERTSHAVLRSGQLVSWGGNTISDTDRLIQIGTSPRLQYIHPFAAYAGGEAELYSTPSGLLKKYHAPEKTPALAKLQHLIAHPVTLPHDDRPLIIWPQELAYHPFTGELVGYVMPFVAATQLIDVLDRTKRITRWPDLATDPRREWQFVLTIARWSAVVLAHIHAHGYVVGDLSPRNILVYEEGTVAFVDCDSYQVGDGSVYGCSVSTAGYRAPEVRQRAHGRLQYSVHSDAFALAVAIFRLLCGNLHPYQGITLPSATLTPAQYRATKLQYPHLQPIPDGVDATTYCYERGIWPYDATQQLCVPPVEMQAYYLQLPVEVRGLFGRAFTGAPAQRPTPLEWVQVLDVLDVWLGEVR
jgi:alpha-tubulin suppressor-like RCC1 family protein